jgi:hypothetical protein
MREDLGRFSDDLKASVQRLFLKRDEINRKRILDIADPFQVPCIVIAYWCGEVSGWPDYLKQSVDSCMKFYRYIEIKNKPEGCPW